MSHVGHRWLIDQHLSKDEPCLILIRDIEPDGDKNPFKAEEVEELLSLAFSKEIAQGKIKLMIIPDVFSVNYGRGVGYDVTEHKPPEDIKRISATEIRRRIRNKEEGWKEFVLPGTEDFLIQKFSKD